MYLFPSILSFDTLQPRDRILEIAYVYSVSAHDLANNGEHTPEHGANPQYRLSWRLSIAVIYPLVRTESL